MKSINASLERIHTFGMSNIHKNKFDVEKTDDQQEEDKDSQEKEEEEALPPNLTN